MIDDDDTVRRSLFIVLQGAGYEIIEAANGREGLELARVEKFDVIITDLLMPDIDGLETIKELRKIAPDTKIVAMSGGGRVGPSTYLAMAEKFGAAVTLCKPFSKSELLDALNSLSKKE